MLNWKREGESATGREGRGRERAQLVGKEENGLAKEGQGEGEGEGEGEGVEEGEEEG